MKQIKLLNKKQAMEYLGFCRNKFESLLKEDKLIQYIYEGGRGLQKRYSEADLAIIKEEYVNTL